MIADSVDRWGDYTNVQRIYNNPSRAYLAGSFGKGSGNATWISMIDNVEWPLAVDDVNAANAGTIFPNPVTQQRFTTKFENETGRHLRFEILDMQGRRISLMLDTYIKKGLNEFSFNTGKLATGNYIFKISTPEGQPLESHKLTIE
jgi:hypothetical protein